MEGVEGGSVCEVASEVDVEAMEGGFRSMNK